MCCGLPLSAWQQAPLFTLHERSVNFLGPADASGLSGPVQSDADLPGMDVGVMPVDKANQVDMSRLQRLVTRKTIATMPATPDPAMPSSPPVVPDVTTQTGEDTLISGSNQGRMPELRNSTVPFLALVRDVTVLSAAEGAAERRPASNEVERGRSEPAARRIFMEEAFAHVEAIEETGASMTATNEQSVGKRPSRPRVVVLGAGFAGLNAALALGDMAVDVTVIDRRNHHTFQPLLYQVAVGVLSPADISQPIRTVLRHKKNTEVLMDEVVGIDTANQNVSLRSGAKMDYDYLVLGTGSTHSYFGKDSWAAIAPGLKTLEDAREMRRRIMLAYELAERDAVETGSHPPLNFVIVGGGPDRRGTGRGHSRHRQPLHVRGLPAHRYDEVPRAPD